MEGRKNVKELSPAEEGELYVMFDHIASAKKLVKASLKTLARQMGLDAASVYEAWEEYLQDSRKSVLDESFA